MHTLQAQPQPSSANLPPAAVPTQTQTQTHLAWRVAPGAHDAASISRTDRAAEQWVWHGRFGTIVIEVRGNDVFVNGDRVAPHAP